MSLLSKLLGLVKCQHEQEVHHRDGLACLICYRVRPHPWKGDPAYHRTQDAGVPEPIVTGIEKASAEEVEQNAGVIQLLDHMETRLRLEQIRRNVERKYRG